MTRVNFFKSLFVLAISPTIIAEATEPKCVFDEKRINDRLKELRKYPLIENECYYEMGEEYHRYVSFMYKDGKLIRLK